MKTKVCAFSVLVAVIWLLPSVVGAQAVNCDLGESLQRPSMLSHRLDLSKVIGPFISIRNRKGG